MCCRHHCFRGFQIYDVDADEALLPGGSVFGDNRITLTISVTKGRFLTPTPAGTVVEVLPPPPPYHFDSSLPTPKKSRAMRVGAGRFQTKLPHQFGFNRIGQRTPTTGAGIIGLSANWDDGLGSQIGRAHV